MSSPYRPFLVKCIVGSAAITTMGLVAIVGPQALASGTTGVDLDAKFANKLQTLRDGVADAKLSSAAERPVYLAQFRNID